MKLTFVSNYFNHHQRPLCDAFDKAAGVDFCFISTEPMEEERIRMGWGIDVSGFKYLMEYFDDAEKADARIQDSDVVIWGGAYNEEAEKSLYKRVESRKLTFRYSERIYKEGQWKFISPKGLKKKHKEHIRFRKYPFYLLCAGAYVGSDYRLIGAYPKKKFVWGYFPEFREYDTEKLMGMKSRKGEPVRLLWAGRMIDWKHPEIPILAAEMLLKGDPRLTKDLTGRIAENGGFVLTMAGGGDMENELKKMIREKGLESIVRFTGYMAPDEIRAEMERSDIFLFTSDRKEGWGAVLNEAMNSGCLVVTRPEIGAVPYMVQHGLNGMVSDETGYRFAGMVGWSILNRKERVQQGIKAYETVRNYWNAENAADSFLKTAAALLKGGEAAYTEKDPVTGALKPMCKDPEIPPSFGAGFVHRY